MGTISTFAKLALGYEDSFGKVLAGSSGKGARTLWKNAGADGARGYRKFSNFVKNANTEVLRFDSKMALASDVFDKGTLKAIRKTKGGNNKQFYKKLIDLVENNPTKKQISEFLTENGVTNVKQSRSLFKKIKGLFSGTKAETLTADKIASNAFEKLSNVAKNSTDDVLEGAVKSTKGAKGLFKSLKGKGGTIGIIMSVGFEAIDVIKAIKNGDGAQQVGRSAFNIGGFAGGAAIGAAVGSIIPVAGTGIGALVGGLCGFVGGMLGGSVTTKLGEAVFGKSIADQKSEAKEKQAEEYQKQAMLQPSQGMNTLG